MKRSYIRCFIEMVHASGQDSMSIFEILVPNVSAGKGCQHEQQ